MDKQLNLDDIQKEIILIAYTLKASTGHSGDSLAKSGKAKKRLLEIKKVLQEHLILWQRDSDILRNKGSNIKNVNSAQAELRKAQQNINRKTDKINRLISDVDSALDYCHHIKEKYMSVDKTTETDGCSDFGNSANPTNISEVTSQTIAFLDAEYCGTTSQEYPRPVLGLSANPRDCNITDKIHIGLSVSDRDRRPDCRVAKPEFFQKFCGGRD